MNEFVSLDADTIVCVSQDQLSAELGGETAILSLGDGTYYGLSDSGTLIWTMLQKPVKLGAIRDAVVAAFDVPAEKAERDLIAFLEELRAKKLVTLVAPRPAPAERGRPETG